MDKTECKRCNGTGMYETTLRDLGGRQPDGMGVRAIVPCEMCEGTGQFDHEAYRKSWVL